MRPPLDFLFDCLVSLAAWKIVHKTGTTIVQYRVTANERFRVRRFSMDAGVVYENVIARVYDQFVPPLQPSDRVLDVGAHIGSFSIHLARRFPDIHVLAFEPHPVTFELLEKNISLNSLQKTIRPFRNGVGESDRVSKLFEDSGNTGANSIIETKHTNLKHIPVILTSLPTIFATYTMKRCALLKLDCEGSEYEILSRAPEGLLKKIHTIIMETHPGYSLPTLIRRLKKTGFRVKIVSNGFTHPILKYVLSAPLCIATR